MLKYIIIELSKKYYDTYYTCYCAHMLGDSKTKAQSVQVQVWVVNMSTQTSAILINNSPAPKLWLAS